ncbi:MAG: DNA helicase RecQ [Cetobacterium sp.]|uniref:DNA helicase RecQ n=1 Tax=Cetobacterium sp. TaxID=2071632 RepID=UPI003F35612B
MKTKSKELLKTIYGYNHFRKGQDIILDYIISKNDILGVLPTGGGKSICYQIPALLYPNLTIVVSPLISLMKDQVDSLKYVGVRAGFLNSTLNREEYLNIISRIKNRDMKLLYIAPERLNNENFINFIKDIPISILAIDEAHCISQWGHDFRKSYLDIPRFLNKIKQRPQILALTATATSKVREDIVQKLNLYKPKIYVDGFDRENITFKVKKNVLPEAFISEYIKKNSKKSGIIYASTRKEVDNLYSYLLLKKANVGKYHAGLDEKERSEFQEKFLNDDIKIMIATNAFGMGINKSNVRYVIHRNIPKDLESYYQEAGRAGRDGAASEAILLFFEEDVSTQDFLIEQNKNSSLDLKATKKKKLSRMIEYTSLEGCYREYILKYFGDKRIKNYCGNCGNCKNFKDIKSFTLDAQKVFSCIGRTKESVGISTLTNILIGKIDSKIERKEYFKLSTFNIMSSYKRVELEEFIYYLISENYLEQSAGSFPTLKLTSKAFEVLKNLKTVFRKSNEFITFDYFEDPLFEKLNELRKDIAQKEEVPPYIIFSDLTLIELAETKPKNRWEMLKVRGIGNQKFKNYGDLFLKTINELSPQEVDMLDIDNLIDEKYLKDEKLLHLKKALNINITTNELKEILIKTLFID